MCKCPNSTRFHAMFFPASGVSKKQLQPQYQLLNGIPGPLHNLKRKRPSGVISGLRGGPIHLFGPSVDAHHLVERKRLVGGVPFARLQIIQAYRNNFYCSLSSLERRVLYLMTKACLRPYYLGHYLSLETVPAIAWWTVFQVLVFHIRDGNVFALQ